MIDNAPRNAAVSNSIGAVHIDKRFPDSTFVGDWDNYLFFEESIIFEMEFVALKNLLIKEGQASVIALANLDSLLISANDSSSVFFLNERTTEAEYLAKLRGNGSSENWLFQLDRYVSASDIGTWCIYIERHEDLAVFASRNCFPSILQAHIASFLRASAFNLANIDKATLILVNSFQTGRTSFTQTTGRTVLNRSVNVKF